MNRAIKKPCATKALLDGEEKDDSILFFKDFYERLKEATTGALRAMFECLQMLVEKDQRVISTCCQMAAMPVTSVGWQQRRKKWKDVWKKHLPKVCAPVKGSDGRLLPLKWIC